MRAGGEGEEGFALGVEQPRGRFNGAIFENGDDDFVFESCKDFAIVTVSVIKMVLQKELSSDRVEDARSRLPSASNHVE
jgi:hypothetical protein